MHVHGVQGGIMSVVVPGSTMGQIGSPAFPMARTSAHLTLERVLWFTNGVYRRVRTYLLWALMHAYLGSLSGR